MLRKGIKFSKKGNIFRKVILNVDTIVSVLIALKIQIVNISITRDIVSHIRLLHDCTVTVSSIMHMLPSFHKTSQY